MNKTALLIVDVQTALIMSHPYQENEMISNIKELLSESRGKKLEVIYVRHDGGVGDELERDSLGWQIYREIAPVTGEMIIDKCFNSAFRCTELKNYLEEQEIKAIILVGLQTEYCIDTTCKVAFEFGYNIVIPEGTVTTFDNHSFTAEQINRHYYSDIWKDRFAKVMPIEKVISMI